MHAKIQGGGEGRYSNSGSCSNVVSYLEHEDFERIQNDEKVETFFSHNNDNVDPNFIIDSIDNNRKKLCRNDAKFFVITISLSENELKHLSKIDGDMGDRIRGFVRHEVMERYAENFNKGLKAEDLMYFGKIHHERKINSKNEFNQHCHIIVSRKTLNDKIKISPMTNHMNTNNGAVKGGFARTVFYDKIEKSFDNRFIYPRELDESFEYKNEMKKASPTTIQLLTTELLQQKGKKIENLNEIRNQCDVFGLNNEVKENLLKGYQYDISGEYQFSHSNFSFNLDQETISIQLRDNKFELMLGKSTFLDFFNQVNKQANERSSSEENQNKMKPKFRR